MISAGFQKTEISKQLNISWRTACRAEQRLKGSEFLNNLSRSGKPQIKSQRPSKSLRKRSMLEYKKSCTEKEISVSTVFKMVKKIEGKVWDVPGNSCREQQWFRSVWREAPVIWMIWKNHGSWILIFFPWETSYRWSSLQQIEWPGCNVWEWCLWMPQSVNNGAANLNHDAWRHSIERGDDVSGLVLMDVQANLCGFQRTFGDEISSTGQEDN